MLWPQLNQIHLFQQKFSVLQLSFLHHHDFSHAISQVQCSSSTQPHIAKSLLKFAIKSSIFGICITSALSHESPTGSKIKDCAYLSLEHSMLLNMLLLPGLHTERMRLTVLSLFDAVLHGLLTVTIVVTAAYHLGSLT